MQSQFRVGEPKPGPGLSSRRMYLCRARGCGVSFLHYAGVKVFAGGLGLCKQHNPAYKEAPNGS